MKFIPIPPIELQENFIRHHTFALAHMLNNIKYARFFKRVAGRTESILDNGAYEGDSYPINLLINMALDYGFSELVLPDILHDADNSTVLTVNSFKTLQIHPRLLNSDLRFMIVPQGETLLRWARSLEILCEEFVLRFADAPFTIGIPKVTAAFPGKRRYLLEHYAIPAQEKYGFDMHLLGISETLTELKTLAWVFEDEIRSIDSARPFNWAWEGKGISELFEPIGKPKRPKNYFNLEWPSQARFLSDQNVAAYERLCLHVPSIG